MLGRYWMTCFERGVWGDLVIAARMYNFERVFGLIIYRMDHKNDPNSAPQ